MTSIRLPVPERQLELFTMPRPQHYDTARPGDTLARRVLAAAHVVADPLADNSPWTETAVDFDATLRFREHLWSLGLGVAEVMDTAQRGMGLSWADAKVIAAHSLKAARGRPDAVIYVGVGTDHLPPTEATLDTITRAYLEQIDTIQSLDGRMIVMASRALARSATSPRDFADVYRRILGAADKPVILHWLGPMFDPALDGYWGSKSLSSAMDHCLDVLAENAAKIEGIKISLLDKQLEIDMRRRLPANVRMYTGDDYNYPELIAGDGGHTSDALLGIFDPIAPVASAALKALTRSGESEFRRLLDPTVAMSREIFKAPTWFYKTGVVLIAYLAGHQNHFAMLGGQQSARPVIHLARVFRLGAELGLYPDPDMAAHRFVRVLAVHGIEQ
mgnify:CR=1 FL=1